MKKGIVFLLIWVVCTGGVSIPVQEAHAISLEKIASAVWAGVTYACDFVEVIELFSDDSLSPDSVHMVEQMVQDEGSGTRGAGFAVSADPCGNEQFRNEMMATVGSDSIDEFCGYLEVLAKGGELPE